MSTVSLEVSVTEFSVTNIAEMTADRLWSTDNAEELADAIVSACENEENEDGLIAFVEQLHEKTKGLAET